jgi:hypothetical protein
MHLAPPATFDEFYWLARVTLLSAYEHIEIFNRVFRNLLGELADPLGAHGDVGRSSTAKPHPHTTDVGHDRSPPRAGAARSGHTDGSSPASDATDDDSETLGMSVSHEERLRRADFAALTHSELAVLRKLMSEMQLAPPPRHRRRLTPASRGQSLDVRTTLRRSQRTAGDPVRRCTRDRSRRPRRVVVLADVSGSMEPYARAYLQLLHSAVGGTRAEAFVFATRLTRLTRRLSGSNPNTAIQRAVTSTPDWSGGTRIGSALKAFVDEWGRRGMARGAVVVIISDGWDSGEPAVLGEQMERLARLAHRIVWVNPRAQSARWQPLAAGMAAAYPFVDELVSGHSAHAMSEVLTAISR